MSDALPKIGGNDVGVSKNLGRITLCDLSTKVEHSDPIRYLFDQAYVVLDKEYRQAERPQPQ
jgi:hypothetical protein